MRRIILTTACATVALAAMAVTAHALPTFWEVKATASGPWEKLTIGTKETLKTTAGFGITGKLSSGQMFKSGCTWTDTEVIENEALGEGIDEMTAFEGSCKPTAPSPCVSSEAYFVRAVGLPWPSQLVTGVNDVFEKVEVEVECAASLVKAFYKPPGTIWQPKLATNALKSTAASGVFKKGAGVWFVLVGTDKLKPLVDFEVR
jgi:hypothetical protein